MFFTDKKGIGGEVQIEKNMQKYLDSFYLSFLSVMIWSFAILQIEGFFFLVVVVVVVNVKDFYKFIL